MKLKWEEKEGMPILGREGVEGVENRGEVAFAGVGKDSYDCLAGILKFVLIVYCPSLFKTL